MKPISAVNITSIGNYLSLSAHSKRQDCPGVMEYHYEYRFSPEVRANLNQPNPLPLEDKPFVSLHIAHDILGISGMWKPDSGFHKNLIGDWGNCFQTNISHSAPVLCFFDCEGMNCLTLSIDEVSRDLHFTTGVHEETAEIYADITVYPAQTSLPCHLRCRIDQRPLPFYQVLKDTAAWWDSLLPESPLPAPREATMPMYSTWYSYHQDMTAEGILAECRAAVNLGMETVIIDDGWQTADNNRGYGYCGDWKAEPSKFPDFGGFVEQLHRLGMKCILWYSVPFVGEYSEVWDQLHSYCLHYEPALHASVLDPRYPQIRSYLISVYKKAVLQWNLDGLKLDFIDSFRAYPDTPSISEGMDYPEIQDAVCRLMLDIRYALTEAKPELLLEFRQNYIGPQMRRFGNFFRVSDCPLSGITNRVGITDLKLLCGSSAVHSDMILWNDQEAPEDVAIQLINCIFATMQISVRLNTLREEQRKVLKHYLDFSITYREVLLEGDFSACSPLGLYPFLQSSAGGVRIAAVYDAGYCADLSANRDDQILWILNATHSTTQYVILPPDSSYTLSVYDCSGALLSRRELCCPDRRVSILPTAPGGALLLESKVSKQ